MDQLLLDESMKMDLKQNIILCFLFWPHATSTLQAEVFQIPFLPTCDTDLREHFRFGLCGLWTDSYLISAFVSAVIMLRSVFMYFFCLPSLCRHHYSVSTAGHLNMEGGYNSDKGQQRDEEIVNLFHIHGEAKLEGTNHNAAVFQDIAWEMSDLGFIFIFRLLHKWCFVVYEHMIIVQSWVQTGVRHRSHKFLSDLSSIIQLASLIR